MATQYNYKKRAFHYGFLMAVIAIAIGLVIGILLRILSFNIFHLTAKESPFIYGFLIQALPAAVVEELLRYFFSDKMMREPLFDASKAINYLHITMMISGSFMIFEDIQTVVTNPGLFVARLVTFPFHFCMAIYMAVLIFEGKKLLAYIVPTVVHTVWDGLTFSVAGYAMTHEIDGDISTTMKVFLVGFIIFIVIVFVSALVLYLKYRKKERQ